MSIMQVGIVGNGAIGGLLCLRAHQRNIPFKRITRVSDQMDLNCLDLNGNRSRLSEKTISINEKIESDLIILPLKAYQIDDALASIAKNLKPEQIVVLLNNGMISKDIVHQHLPDNPVIAATTSHAAFKPAADKLNVTGLGQTAAGWYLSPQPTRSRDIQLLLETLVPPCSWQENIPLALWRKLAINAVINPLTAIYNVNNGELLNTKFKDQINTICDETAKVMSALGFTTSSKELMQSVLQVAEQTAKNSSSMRQDVLNNRRTEVEYINGYIYHEAQRMNISVPENKDLLEQVMALTDV